MKEATRWGSLAGCLALLLLAAGCSNADRRAAAEGQAVPLGSDSLPQTERGAASGVSEVRRGSQGSGDDRWSGLGIMAVYQPEYEGSDDYGVRGYPIIDLPVGDPILLDTRNGLGVYIFSRSGVKIGLAAGYRFGRDEDASDDLDGLGDVEGGVTANAVAEWHVGDFRLGALLERQITGDETGLLLELTARYDLQVARGLSLRSTIVATHADEDYMDSYFGVTVRQSGRSGLPAFEADPGFMSVGLRERIVLRLSDRWSLHGLVAYRRLIGDAADSPVTQDDDQFFMGLGVAYRF